MTLEQIRNLDPDRYPPLEKDRARVEEFWADQSFGRCRFYGNGTPSATGAKRMAKAIKDPEKLLRRSRAVVQRWGTRQHTGFSGGKPVTEDVWEPFRTRLQELGFTWSQIAKVENSR